MIAFYMKLESWFPSNKWKRNYWKTQIASFIANMSQKSTEANVTFSNDPLAYHLDLKVKSFPLDT